jgi:predicted kinase
MLAMAREVVLVNGYPGSGKSTVGAALAAELDAPFLSKDRVKEALASAVSFPGPRTAFGAVAMETAWNLAAAIGERVVVDSWWFRPRDRDHAIDGLRACGAQATVEVWCDVPAALARTRYEARTRNPIHEDNRDMTHEWARWETEGQPLAIGPVIRLRTTGPLTTGAITACAQQILGTFTPTAGRRPR